MGDLQEPQRPRYRFSLRKLMLWTVVLCVYLGIVRMVWDAHAFGDLKRTSLWLFIVIIISPAVLLIRVTWGFRLGWLIATLGVGVNSICVVIALQATMLGRTWGLLSDGDTGGVILAVGVALGFLLFIPAHLIVCAVDYIDKQLETRTPKDS